MLKNISQIIKKKTKQLHIDNIKIKALWHDEIPARVYEMLGLQASVRSKGAKLSHRKSDQSSALNFGHRMSSGLAQDINDEKILIKGLKDDQDLNRVLENINKSSQKQKESAATIDSSYQGSLKNLHNQQSLKKSQKTQSAQSIGTMRAMRGNFIISETGQDLDRLNERSLSSKVSVIQDSVQ